MKPIRDIIVKVPIAYKKEVGSGILLDENIKQVKDTIRHGEVVYIPSDIDIDVQVGDKLYFHHGIVAKTVMDGRPDVNSPYLVDSEQSLYRVPVNKDWPFTYAVVRDGKLRILKGVCFVRQIKEKKYDTSLYVHNNEREVLNVGEMVYPDEYLENNGVVKGTRVMFEKDSEYKFEIEGEELYRMFSKWIIGVDED